MVWLRDDHVDDRGLEPERPTDRYGMISVGYPEQPPSIGEANITTASVALPAEKLCGVLADERQSGRRTVRRRHAHGRDQDIRGAVEAESAFHPVRCPATRST